MSDGYAVDVTTMTATARRLDETADEVTVLAAGLAEGAGGDLGPDCVTAAVDELTRSWGDRLGAVRDALAGAAEELRAGSARYREADELRHE